MGRIFSLIQRRILIFKSAGRCARCNKRLAGAFHADHIVPWSKGGRTLINNGQALCEKCNLQKGSKMGLKLRDWQEKAISKAIKWLVVTKTDKHFLINAAPGAGKTIASCELTRRLIELGEVERVIVIAPRREVVRQWADDFKFVTDRYMSRVTGSDDDIKDLDLDVCATWAAVQGLLEPFQAVCRSSKTMVICDEHHHAAIEAAWGDGATSAFAHAKFVLILTGTPIRSDGNSTAWLAYDDRGKIDHPEEGTYTLTYGEAVDLGYCRPVTFHRHDGRFTVSFEDEEITVSSGGDAELTGDLKKIPALKKALSFYRLACTPLYEADNPEKPLNGGYQWSMVEWGSDKLTDLRNRMPNAGGLVIAPNIAMAEYFVKVIEEIEGEKPYIVHSEIGDAEGRIAAFRNTNKRWIVSVAMISEGVDIPRLRVLVYLPNASTEVAFRQAIGRVVRTAGPDDDSRAYVIMPSWEIFDKYARRVESEMSAAAKKEDTPSTKKCPSCSTELPLNATTCNACGHEFPVKPRQMKNCPECDALNRLSASACHSCGHSFLQEFKLTLEDAMRVGAIVRGIDMTEEEVQESEVMAPKLRELFLASGDEKIIKMLKTFPEETYARLAAIMAQASKKDS
jgi:superfamily II DNA or RNA helicase